MKTFLLGVLIGPFVWIAVGIIFYCIGRIMWNIRPKDGVEGANKFWNQFAVYDKKYLDEN
jgi:predicted membrane channel-forming protein YqfA (hemolysin III family)